jgi:hypothetical protein
MFAGREQILLFLRGHQIALKEILKTILEREPWTNRIKSLDSELIGNNGTAKKFRRSPINVISPTHMFSSKPLWGGGGLGSMTTEVRFAITRRASNLLYY